MQCGPPSTGQRARDANHCPGWDYLFEPSCRSPWRVNQLTRPGLAEPAAEAVADLVDGHQVDKLVQSRCPVGLTVAILD